MRSRFDRRPLRILLIKPFQPVRVPVHQPPMGLLYLAGAARARFGERVEVAVWDMRIFEDSVADVLEHLRRRPADLVGLSALNHEADAAHAVARAVKARFPETLTAIGGPYAHSNRERIVALGDFDWSFDGEADRTFPAALAAHFFGEGSLAEIPGLTWRTPAGFRTNPGTDTIAELDTLPRPAWDLVPFEVYARRPNMNGWLKGRRYAPIFTSRGCPYKCTYCHDIFGKRFRWRSAEDVVAEIVHLHETYGIDEFQIIDDIFNLHKPRMRRIARLVIDHFGPRRLKFCFPNGIRADIFDVDDLPLLAEMGVYQITVAVETVTPRLQRLVQKNLDIERVQRVIAAADRMGILSKGFFMLGFPTETVAEIEATIRWAVRSRLTFAGFYLVTPQRGTPLYDLAREIAPEAAERASLNGYYNEKPWYQVAYGVDTRRLQQRAFRRFYLTPWRVARLARNLPLRRLLEGFGYFLHIATPFDPLPYTTRERAAALPEAATTPEEEPWSPPAAAAP